MNSPSGGGGGGTHPLRFDDLKRSSRSLEGQLAAKMMELERRAAAPDEWYQAAMISSSSGIADSTSGGGEDDAADRREAEMQSEFDAALSDVTGLLKDFQATVQTMVALACDLPSSHPHHHVVFRLQSVYEDQLRASQRASSEFTRKLQRLLLVSHHRRDMSRLQDMTEVNLMMEEQSSLRKVHGNVSRILEQANMTQAQLRQQKDRFAHTTEALVQVLERVPVIRRALSRIDQKRRRDVVCFGAVVGVCLFLVVVCW